MSYENIPHLPKKSVKAGRVRTEEFVFDKELNDIISKINTRFSALRSDPIEFENGDLSGGILSVTHGLGIKYPSSVSLYDNNGKFIGNIGNWDYFGTAINAGELHIYEPSITGIWTLVLG